MATELETATERVRQQGGLKSFSGSKPSQKATGLTSTINGKQFHLHLHSPTNRKIKKYKIDHKIKT